MKKILLANAIGFMHGPSGSYKSFIAIDLGLHIAHGLRWCGQKTVQGATYFIAGEGATGLFYRIAAWHKLHDLSPEEAPFLVCPVPVALNEKDQAIAIQAEISANIPTHGQPRLIVVDTFSQNFEGDENDSGAVSGFLRNLTINLRIAFPDCSILIIHHPGHGDQKRARGSSVIRSNPDFEFRVESTALSATLHSEKIKESDRDATYQFHLHKIELGADEDGDPITSLAAQHISSSSASTLKELGTSRERYGKYDEILSKTINCTTFPATKSDLWSKFDTLSDQSLSDKSRRKGFDRAIDKAIEQEVIVRNMAGLFDRATALDGECE